MNITNKKQMYVALQSGEFGNTIPQFLSIADWLNSPDSQRYELWGVRSGTISAHPACRLNCPREEVVSYAAIHFPAGPNISMMVDAVAEVTAWLEIWESPTGLVVEGIEHPDTAGGWNWRNSMRDPARRKSWEKTAASLVLSRHLNANSVEDLRELLTRFPGHVVELSALNRCIGSVPHRNAVVWEVRLY